ncbi:alpha-galactosidase [Hamadaea tsunoensis]|uniref:alpha-galactosidase n=1 Tax=Hamadaea tsunoensis TaxID=53368 RepID=UPI00048526A6|nr:alpha-galactosidase [Hamadaea tsunoensis]
MALTSHDPASQTWLLRTPASAYALRWDGSSVRSVHWGPPLTLEQAATIPVRPDRDDERTGEEFPVRGGHRFGPPSLDVVYPDGTAAVEWHLAGQLLDGGRLTVALADRHYPLRADLHYVVREGTDVIERWTEITNTGPDPVEVRRADSAAWTVPWRDAYRLTSVSGAWAAEFQLQRTPLPVGETTLTTRRGIARGQGNPWVMVDTGDATETSGEVWSTVLAWSGPFRFDVRRTHGGHVHVAASGAHEGVTIRLAPGETWRTPSSLGLYRADGFGATSRSWHAYARAHVLQHADEVAPVLYNGWEGTWFDVNEENQKAVATIAAGLGVELFVMDDGWFGRRVDDHAGLGDWWPNPDRFPDGLGPLIEHVHGLGMKFGIWVEPEMVNPDSDLYRRHPDWVLHMHHRHRSEQRNQLVLNFARPDVAAWAYAWLDDLLSSNAIDFVKWDMNRSFTEAGWPTADDPDRLWAGHTRAVYDILDRLRATHPHVRVESCASGGGRVDLGILARTDQVWTSDNTDPVDRIAIQHGYSQVYPAIAMGSWASDSPNPITHRAAPLAMRFHVASAGALGVSGNLREWDAGALDEARSLVDAYKRVRKIVQHGELHRLANGTTTVVEYVSADRREAVVLAWRPSMAWATPQPPVRLAGLDPDVEYELVGTAETYSGAVLMGHGLDLALPPGPDASRMIHVRGQ